MLLINLLPMSLVAQGSKSPCIPLTKGGIWAGAQHAVPLTIAHPHPFGQLRIGSNLSRQGRVMPGFLLKAGIIQEKGDPAGRPYGFRARHAVPYTLLLVLKTSPLGAEVYFDLVRLL